MLTIGTYDQATTFDSHQDAADFIAAVEAQTPTWAVLSIGVNSHGFVIAVVAQGGADAGTTLGHITREEGVAEVERPSDLTGTRTH